MGTPSRRLIIAMIVVILAFVAIVIVLPEREIETVDADLVFLNDSDALVGSAGVGFARWDGSSVTEMGMNADNTPIKRGDGLAFDSLSWPLILTVYSDRHGNEVLAQIVVEEAPAENEAWLVTLNDSLYLVLESVPKG